MRFVGQKSLAERLEGKFIPEPNSGCWLWTAAMRTDGYGHVNTGFGHQPAHRVAWRVYRGEIPDGLFVLHKCDNRLCMNPDHLELGTQKTNLMQMVERGRGRQKTATHCAHGHPYDDANTYYWHGQRQCRACKYNFNLRYVAEKKYANK